MAGCAGENPSMPATDPDRLPPDAADPASTDTAIGATVASDCHPAGSAPVLSAAAQRALQEAEERRQKRAGAAVPKPTEVGGREGPDPVRYGDWETGGIASDF